MPKISVVSTVHNGAAHVEQVADSILGQEFDGYEWLILDDCSTDETPSLLANLADEHPVVTVLTPAERLGRARGLNRVVEAADGDYIAQQDFDDVSCPGRLREQAAYLDAHDRVGVVGSYYERVDEIRGERYVRAPPTDHDDLVRAMTKYIPIAHTLATFRKTSWRDAGGYPITDDHEDIGLWIRMVGAGWELANVPEMLGTHYVYADSTWNSRFSYIRRQRRLAAVQAGAVRRLALPSWMYLYPVGRMLYPYLPTSLKRYVRRTVEGLSERPV
jgi:glycosyltransferase EpsE